MLDQKCWHFLRSVIPRPSRNPSSCLTAALLGLAIPRGQIFSVSNASASIGFLKIPLFYVYEVVRTEVLMKGNMRRYQDVTKVK